MKKKYIFIIVTFASILAVGIWIYLIMSQKKNAKSDIIGSIPYAAMDERYIGSEPPKLLYADQDKVIFKCDGVYVYDVKKEMLVRSFDVQALAAENQRRWDSFALKDGERIVFHISDDQGQSYGSYSYSCKDKHITEINDKVYKKYRENAFECTYLSYEDELYRETNGMIVNVSEEEYVYLTFEDWLVNTIKIVYVKDGRKTEYKVF